MGDTDLERQALPSESNGRHGSRPDVKTGKEPTTHPDTRRTTSFSEELDYKLEDIRDVQRIEFVPAQDIAQESSSVNHAEVVLLQRPRLETARSVVDQLGVHKEFFLQHFFPPRQDDESEDDDEDKNATEPWWHLSGSTDSGPLMQFEPGSLCFSEPVCVERGTKLGKQLSSGRKIHALDEILGLIWLEAFKTSLEDAGKVEHEGAPAPDTQTPDQRAAEDITSDPMDDPPFVRSRDELHHPNSAQTNHESSSFSNIHGKDSATLRYLDENYKKIEADLDEHYMEIQAYLKRLEDEVKETFQLLAISIQIKDTAVAKTQASRATALTVIATIYLPASLAVGAFGMNTEYLGAELSIKWPIILTAALFAPSAIVLLILFLRE
ncbi:hypothetical protein CBER1_07839 [Cercospora berteroae]|uniref:Uncharacterized protein n=1 Tax=Cercospora berteroae TaxID=357750 RepID=A0A2S6C529_9PEZI|nr:hypothetical protein CBER1_07839 [Cercospora berteroae]